MIAALPASIYWHLPIVLFVVCLVYSATRYDHWGNILWETLRWARRMLTFLCGIAVVLYLLSLFI